MTRCCCCTLQTGGLIIGSLETVGGILGTIICSVFLGLWNIAGKELKNFDFDEVRIKLFGDKKIKSFDLENVDEETFHAAAQARLTFLTIITGILLVISILQTFISSILIRGIRKKSSLWLAAWMVSKLIFIALVSLMCVSSIINGGFNRVHIIMSSILLGLSVVYLYIINSLRKQIKAEENTRPSQAHNKNCET